jgi:pyridoxal phosphate enzyme (YggS family)
MLTGPQFSAVAATGNLLNGLAETRKRIASAALRYSREAESVGLVAISKTQPAEAIEILADAGQCDFGENYLQEALPKLEALTARKLTWHFTGQLQSNKTRLIAEHFHWVHTLDREKIAARLSEQRPHYAPPLNICIQVRLEDEAGKGGVAAGDVLPLARKVAQLPRLALRGLMCIPPPRETFDEQLAYFKRLAECQRRLQDEGLALDTLSMGMSADLEAAIAAGATWVRIGTSIFGERPTP